MTSKNLFYKLQKEDLKRRIWTIALSVLAFFLFLTVVLAISIGNFDTSHETREQIIDNIARLIGPRSVLVSFITIAAGIICGLSSFFYLHSRKKVDLFHSIPVRREVLFAVNYLNGVLIYLVPYIINIVLCFIILQINGYMSAGLFVSVLMAVGINLLFYCLIYTLAIAAVMLTGNFIVSCLGTAVFLVYGPVLMGIKIMYYQEFFKTYAGDRADSTILKFLSPIGSYLDIADLRSFGNYQVDFGSILKTVLVTVLLILFSLLLYKKRPSEAAGRAMAFSVSKPVIKFLLVIPTALAGGIIFRQIAADDSTGWFIFGLVFAFIVSCGIIEIIYNFDIRSVFDHKRHMLISGGVVAVIVCVFQFDLFRYDQYIPDKNKIESMSVSISGLDNNLDYLEQNPGGYGYTYINSDTYQLKHMELTDFGAAYDLAGKGIEDVRGYREINSEDYYTFRIKYSLKNGRNVYRNYSLTLENSYDQLKDVFEKEEFKKGHYPVYNWEAGDISYISCYNMSAAKEFSLSEEEKQEFLDIYRSELMQLTLDEVTAGQPEATIEFWLKEETASKQRGNREANYFVYPQFVKTQAFLKAHGFDPSEKVGTEDIKSISINNYQPLTDNNAVQQAVPVSKEESVTYVDKEKIAAILPLLVESDYYWNFRSILKCESNLEVNLVIKKDDYGNEESYICYFKDSIPDFVKTDTNYREEQTK